MTNTTYTKKQWAEIEAQLKADGYSQEECDYFMEVIAEEDHAEELNDLRETRRHYHFEEYDTDGDSDDCAFGSGHSISLDEFEFKMTSQGSPIFALSAEDEFIDEDHISCLMREALSMLKESHRNIIVAVYYAQLSFTEYAQIYGKTPQWAQQLHGTAIKKLEQILRESFKKGLADAFK